MSPETPLPQPYPQAPERRPFFDAEHLPSELFEYSQWVCWRYVDRGADRKPDKQPVNPRTLGNAGVHWANTWSSFEQALSVYALQQAEGIVGLGFVLTRDDPFVGIDLDDCIEKGEFSDNAQNVMRQLISYTEVSPSMRGLRILVACSGFGENVRTPNLEVYSHSRFLTLTGDHVDGTPRTIATVAGAQLTATIPAPRHEPGKRLAHETGHTVVSVDHTTLWERIFAHDRYGAEHLRRFQGDVSLDRGDHSLAVIRLLNTLARWTEGDAVKMREMMMLSPLANEKWFSKRGKGDWLDHQIRDAISFVKRGK